MTRLVVSKINAIPSAKIVNGVDWIDGIQRLTETSTECKLALKNVTSKKPKSEIKQTMNNERSVLESLDFVFFTFSDSYNIMVG